MKIVLYSPYRISPTEVGGVTVFVTRLQRSLSKRGHKVFVVEPGDNDRIAPCDDKTTYPLTYTIYLRPMWVKRSPLKAFIAFWLYLPLSLYELWRFLKQEGIEIVHLHFPSPSSLYFCVLRLISRWKLVATFHGSDAYLLSKRTWVYRTLLALALRRMDMITTVSNDLLICLERAYPNLGSKKRAILNAAFDGPLDSFSGGSTSGLHLPVNYILTVGSIIPRKGYDVLLKAMRITCDRGRNFNLVIVGGGENRYASKLATMVKVLGLEDCVVFAGEVAHPEIVAVYSRAKFFVLASRQEGIPLVLLEAMSCRKAVVATRVNGVPELIHDGENGLLVEPEDADSLAEAMIRLDEDDALREYLAERGQKHVVHERTWERLTSEYLETYKIVHGSVSIAHDVSH